MQSMFDCDRQAAAFLPVILHRGHWLRGDDSVFCGERRWSHTSKNPQTAESQRSCKLEPLEAISQKKRENKSNLK